MDELRAWIRELIAENNQLKDDIKSAKESAGFWANQATRLDRELRELKGDIDGQNGDAGNV